MTIIRPNSDTTIRGGIINVPASISPTHPPRHQPDTPRTKKTVKVKPDHQIHSEDPPVLAEDTTPTPAAPPVPPPDEPAPDPSP